MPDIALGVGNEPEQEPPGPDGQPHADDEVNREDAQREEEDPRDRTAQAGKVEPDSDGGRVERVSQADREGDADEPGPR